MELGEVMMWVLNGLLLAGILLILYMSMDIKRIAEESDAPYKIEPAKPRKKVGRPPGSKGGYTKRSVYWDEKRKKSAARKVHKKKIVDARKRARVELQS